MSRGNGHFEGVLSPFHMKSNTVTDGSESQVDIRHQVVIKKNAPNTYEAHRFFKAERSARNAIDDRLLRDLFHSENGLKIPKLQIAPRIRLADMNKIGLFAREALQNCLIATNIIELCFARLPRGQRAKGDVGA